MTGPPDFIGVGTQRSGTTWWFGSMLAHPRIRPSPGRRKELHFFNKFRAREMTEADVAAYHELFPRRPGEFVGEWTPRYMRDFWAPPLLRRAAPDARVLVLLRDPVERFRSGIVHALRRRPRPPEAIATDAIDRGRYHSQLQRLRAHFPEEQILVLQYEQCRSEPLEQYRRTLRFLGVPEAPEPPDFARTRGRPATPEKEELWGDMVESLQATLEDEVRRLPELVPDLDLSLWPNFAHLADGSGAARPLRRAAPAGAAPAAVRPGSRGRRSEGPPDFVGVGAPACGSEWWQRALLEHPDVRGPRGGREGLHFFDQFCARAMTDADVRAYHGRFARRAGAVSGEWTPRYMIDAWTPPLLWRAVPDAKLLVMVRDPIERYRSRLPPAPPVDESDAALDPAGPGRYATHLEPLRELFGPERVLVLQTERCLRDPLGEYARTLRFLGLRDDFRARALRRRPEQPARRWPWSRARRAAAAEPRELWPEILESLQRVLEPEVEALARMVPALDLSLWPNFAHLALERRPA